MNQQTILSFALLLLFHFTAPTTSQTSPSGAPFTQPMVPAPPAQAPSPPVTLPPASSPVHLPPLRAITNVTNILEKAGHFSVFLRLLKSTQEDNHLTTVLNNTNNGLTLFVPTDSAFSGLKSGTLNVLSDDQKSKLIKYHEVPMYLSNSQFQTVSNPIATEAGGGEKAGINVTASSDGVSISTGLTNTSISGTVYSDNQLAIYRVDKVLLSRDIFDSKAPAPAPAKAKEPKKKSDPDVAAESPVAIKNTTATPAAATDTTPVNNIDTSGAMSLMKNYGVVLGFGLAGAVIFLGNVIIY